MSATCENSQSKPTEQPNPPTACDPQASPLDGEPCTPSAPRQATGDLNGDSSDNPALPHASGDLDGETCIPPKLSVPVKDTVQDIKSFLQHVHLIGADSKFVNVSPSDSSQAVFVTLEPVTGFVLFRLHVANDFTWQLFYRDVQVNTDVLSFNFAHLNVPRFQTLCKTILENNICIGNSDISEVINQCSDYGEKHLYGKKREIVGYLSDNTIRTVNCAILLPEGREGRCDNCRDFRPSLRARATHIRSSIKRGTDRTSSSSKVPISRLRGNEVDVRVKNLSKTINSLQKLVQAKVENEKTQLEAVRVNEEQHILFEGITNKEKDNFNDVFPVGSPERLFWEEQMKCAKAKGPSGMR